MKIDLNTSPQTLKRLAVLVWTSGIAVLLIKSSGLLIEAERLNPGQAWTWLAVFGGVAIGSLKAKYLFSKVCIKNLKRIDALESPKIWNVYRIKFLIFLSVMASLGIFFSRLAQGDYSMLIAVATIELSVATALLGSSYCFRGHV